MAQDQRVDVLFAAQVTGQNQLEKLTQAVEKLRQETEQLKSANGGLASSTEAVIRNGKRYNNELDAQAKALRNARQGTQQLGMQVNDFFTSVSTGASPVQAFNQQIGQVGYAMSMMGGTAGKVGAFLAGPWGAAILVATMALGPFIDSLFEVSEETKAAEEAAKKMDSAIEARINSEYNLRLALADTAEEYRNIRLEMMANAAQAVRTASVELTARLKVLNALQAEQDALEAQAKGAGGLRAQAEMTTGQIFDRARVGGGLNKSITAVRAQITALEMATEKLHATTIDVAQAQRKLDKGSGRADKGKTASEADKLRAAQEAIIKQYESGALTYAQFEERLTSVTNAYKEAKNPAEEFLNKFREADQVAKKFDDAAVNLANKSLPDWLAQLRQLSAEYKQLEEGNRLTTQRTNEYGNMANAIAAGPLEQMLEKYEKMNAELTPLQEDHAKLAHIMSILSEEAAANGANMDYLLSIYARLREEMAKSEIAARNKEVAESYKNIGEAVSESFKGMLTGATSWKNAMKGIIGAVIDELWKLFVVKQIVGFISNALGSAFGGAGGGGNIDSILKSNDMTGLMPKPRAVGGSVMSNSPYIVGERGPELFVPNGNGTIIPNRNLGSGKGGSGMVINVDARGSADPAAVRAQVQQGILEAAPAIIAAAEARTVGGLRRPRLGGVIQ